MHINWHYWFDAIENNKTAILAFLGLVVSSGVKTLPLPGTPWGWATAYTWIYDWSHQFLNVTNTRLATTAVPTPPEPAANPHILPPQPAEVKP